MTRSRLAVPVRALLFVFALGTLLAAGVAEARNPYRSAFFDRYPAADGTALSDLPSSAKHCGVCHFDFDGGGARNPYGLSLETRLAGGMSIDDAIIDVETHPDVLDADNDGFSNLVEVTDTTNWSNTPTFPGLKATNLGSTVNVDVLDLYDPGSGVDFVTPAGSTDTTPPVVTILAPVGGEIYAAETYETVSWTATDAAGIARIEIYLSDDGGTHYRQLADGLPNTGTFDLFIPNLPGGTNILKIEAYDNAGNEGYDESAAVFTISPVTHGLVPTTLRDFDMPGTQPFSGGVLEDPTQTCVACHGNYDPDVEPFHNWKGSMMAQAMRDPLYLATVAVANDAAPGAGDLCLRCHTPGGWSEGRSFDTTGGMMIEKDYEGVQCDFCHRMVDPVYVEGVSPAVDADILGQLETVPLAAANGQFILDPDPVKRGPYADADPSHQWLHSEFTLSSDLCGTCHDVSNPAFVAGGAPGVYDVDALDSEHPDSDRRNMFPVERTYSEWSVSEYATTGVYQPQFAGDKPDGIVSSCQDCHMKDVTGVGSSVGGSPTRSDLGWHDLTGANTFIPDVLPDFYPGIDTAPLQAGKLRAQALLSLAATMELTLTPVDGVPAVNVRLYNETGHKLPSGYPEGRRAWINVKAYDGGSNLVYESGAYDAATGVLTEDADAKIYRIKPGVSTRLAPVLGLPAGPSFHFALNDTVYKDNRIPPRGFTNAAFEAVQSPPVAYAYADGQYWDDTLYKLPAEARSVEVTFYYQSTSKGYVEFLRDNNFVNSMGQDLYNAWVNHGRSAPEIMAQQTALLDVSAVEEPELPARPLSLAQNYPNPFNPLTRIEYTLPVAGTVSLRIYDERGRLVRDLVSGRVEAGEQEVLWDGTDGAGRGCASGVYHYVLKTATGELARKMTLLR